MRIILALTCAAALSGCATTAPVVVRGDNYCRLASPITWSVDDTQKSVDQIRRHNAKRARVCGRKR